MTRREFSWVLGLVALLCLATGAQAQTPSDKALRLVLKGYDPVAYFTDGKAVPGKQEYETVFDGARYRFGSAEHMKLFKTDPDKYAPQFAGACTNGVSRGLKVEANPDLWRIVDGKLFVFYGTSIPAEMASNPHAMIAKAEEGWKSLADKPILPNL